MVEKLLKIILPDKIENRKAEVHKQALDLSPGYSDFMCSISCSYRREEAKETFLQS